MSASPESLEDLRSRLGDRYRIERELGRGGMGAVYLARDRELDRPVALKVLPPELAGNAELRERFLRETRTAASFSHPNIVPVHAVEDREGLLAFAMGYVEGESLAARVKRNGPLSVRETVKFLQDSAYALAYAHGRGVVHRDIKPDNIMIERATGRALVMDFGIAREIAPATAKAGLTRVGEVVGTPEFMSPEQASGDAVDGRSDLYSLGLTAYFALTGTPVVQGTSTQQILVKQLTELPPAVSSLRSDVPAALADAIHQLVQKEPAARFASAEALVEALEQAQLGGHEVPVPIRLFAQEAGMMGLLAFFMTLIGLLLLQFSLARDRGSLDILIPLLFIFAIVWGRATQTFQQAQRLARLGFGVDEILKGLTAVVDERADMRAQLKADSAFLKQLRRKQVLSGLALVAGVVFFRVAMEMRVPNPGGGYHTGPAGAITVFSATIMFGLGLAGLARSPVRAPPGERLFRLLWLRRPGKFYFRLAGAGRPASASASRPVTAPASAAPSQTTKAAEPDRLAALEGRVSALERWRNDSR
ncbi:MAG: serine/threonine-protein kinase [Gemmatimonadales bacterium]